MKEKFLSLMVSMMMVASMIPAPAFAEIIQDNATKQESSAQTSKSEESKTIEESSSNDSTDTDTKGKYLFV
ncbi:MAG: hypothetical protein ACLR3X_00310 [Intestinibacter bartlettii]